MKSSKSPFFDFRRSETLRAIRWMIPPALRLIGVIKDALADLKVNTGIAVSLIGKACWLIPLLLVPHLFASLPTLYGSFERIWPEWGWALLVFALICIDAAALTRKTYSLQMVALSFGTFLWFFFASLLSQGSPHGYFGLWGTPGCYVYGAGAVGCLVGIVYTGQKHRAEQLAADLMVWRQFVEEESARDAPWVRPTDQYLSRLHSEGALVSEANAGG